MPIVFASVSITVLLFYGASLVMAYTGLLPVSLHMIWGLFMTLLIVLLQCLVFGFFIGSGKTIKRVVAENGLGGDWVQKTKEYKNQSYPALMLAIMAMLLAAAAGGAVSVGFLPSAVHQGLIWISLILNARSLWISYQVITQNVKAIHLINREIVRLKEEGKIQARSSQDRELTQAPLPPRNLPTPTSKYYFLAGAVWVPYLYMRWSLGSRNFPFWPFLVLSGSLWLIGWFNSRKKS